MKRPLLALLVAALLVAAIPAGAVQTDVGTAAAQFLQIGGGARALGMGEAYTAVADGPDAVYWNPAGLSAMTSPEAAYARTELPAGLHHDFLAAGFPSQFLHGTLAVGVTRLSQDSLALVNASNQSQGSFSPHSEVYALAYGARFGDSDARGGRLSGGDAGPWIGDIAAGVSLKLIEENLGTRSASAFAVDGGATFRPLGLHDLILAGAFRNIGQKLNFINDAEPLPGELAASAAYDLRAGEDWRVVPALEVDAPYAGNIYGKVGCEATKTLSPDTSAAARLGYTSVSSADLGLLSGLTAGVGLKVAKFSFDAAFQPMAALGESFRLGVGWKF